MRGIGSGPKGGSAFKEKSMHRFIITASALAIAGFVGPRRLRNARTSFNRISPSKTQVMKHG
jgi:hypothetical protein